MTGTRRAGTPRRLVAALALGAACSLLLSCPQPDGPDGNGTQQDPWEITVYWVYGVKILESGVTNLSTTIDFVTVSSDAGDGIGVAIDSPAAKIYWIDADTNSIRRADLDGANDETLVSGLIDPGYIKLDVADNKMYWTATMLIGETTSVVGIHRANLDGSGIELGFVELETNVPTGLAIMTEDPKTLFWAWKDPATGEYVIQKALVDSPLDHVSMVSGLLETRCMDYGGGWVYWTSAAGRIHRVPHYGDDQNVECVVADAELVQDVAVDPVNGMIYWATLYDVAAGIGSAPYPDFFQAELDGNAVRRLGSPEFSLTDAENAAGSGIAILRSAVE